MTEISLIVTLNNQFTFTHSRIVMSRLNDAVSGIYILIRKESLVGTIGYEKLAASDKATLGLRQEELNQAAAVNSFAAEFLTSLFSKCHIYFSRKTHHAI